MPPTGVPAHNPGTCPKRGSNQQLFDSQAATQSTEPEGPISVSHWFYPGLVREMTVPQLKSSKSDSAVILSPTRFLG